MEQYILKRQDLSAEKKISKIKFIFFNLGLNKYLQVKRIEERERQIWKVEHRCGSLCAKI